LSLTTPGGIAALNAEVPRQAATVVCRCAALRNATWEAINRGRIIDG